MGLSCYVHGGQPAAEHDLV